jgi:hypothetical protein
VADDLSSRYAGLLTGSYDCMDRIVLNAFFPLGHSPGGFRHWWRRWHDGSDDTLDNAHLMRMASRFARRVKAWGRPTRCRLSYNASSSSEAGSITTSAPHHRPVPIAK